MNDTPQRPDQRRRTRLSRRTTLVAASSLTSLPLLFPTPAAGRTHHEHRGPFRVTPLVDAAGTFFMPAAQALTGASEQDWQRARELDPAAFGPDDAWVLDFRCFLVRGPREEHILVDTGIGPVGSPATDWAPVPGRLLDAFERQSVAPEDVDIVVLSHLHEDHYGGSVGLDGTPVFQNARYVVQQAELDALPSDSAAVGYLVGPLQAAGQLVAAQGEHDLSRHPAGSVRAFPTPGHTPGHQSVVAEFRSSQVLITGDVFVHAVQVVNPEVTYAFEQDPALARETRRSVLDSASRACAELATAHLRLPFLSARSNAPEVLD